jgi:hypothetical protein
VCQLGNRGFLCAVPSEGVIARLCASGLFQSRKLLDTLRVTRGIFAQGRHNLGNIPIEWDNGRQALMNLSAQLEAMQMSIARHCQDSLGAHPWKPLTRASRTCFQGILLGRPYRLLFVFQRQVRAHVEPWVVLFLASHTSPLSYLYFSALPCVVCVGVCLCHVFVCVLCWFVPYVWGYVGSQGVHCILHHPCLLHAPLFQLSPLGTF